MMDSHQINTYLRIKPSKFPSGYFEIDKLEDSWLNVQLPTSYKSDYIDNTKLEHSFHFNGVIGPKSDQDEVFQLVGIPSLQNVIDGYNSTVFVYGQTGSGKTYTLTGGAERYVDRGLIPRSTSALFKEVKSRPKEHFKISVSYFQIYNDQGYDLLAVEAFSCLEDLPRIKVMEDEDGEVHLRNLSVHSVSTEEEALNLLFLGDTNRVVAETAMNQTSSRSHCVLVLALETHEQGSETVRRSKLNLVDLAGSERVAKTHSLGTVLREAKHINSSLFYLEAVIAALHERATVGRHHVPYRNSLLTLILRDSLGGNCRTAMIATISPEAAHTDESLSTCRFAQRVSQVQNRARVNEVVDPALLVERLRAEVAALREEVAFLKNHNGATEGEDMEETTDFLRVRVMDYCADEDPDAELNIGSISLRKIKECFRIFKAVINEHRKVTPNPITQSSLCPNSDDNTVSPNNSSVDSNQVNGVVNAESSADRDSSSNIVNYSNIDLSTIKIGSGVRVEKRILPGCNGRSIWVASDTSSGTHEESDAVIQGSESTQITIAPTSKVTRGGGTWKAIEEQRQQERQHALDSKILHIQLFDVPPPPTPAVLEDCVAAFRWFEAHCTSKAALDSNLSDLKESIAQAKAAGERANASRETVIQLRTVLADSTKQHTYEGPEIDEDQLGHQANQNSTADSIRSRIEIETGIYKSNFEELRILKVRIEHINQSIAKQRRMITKQFEQWFAFLQSNNFPHTLP